MSRPSHYTGLAGTSYVLHVPSISLHWIGWDLIRATCPGHLITLLLILTCLVSES